MSVPVPSAVSLPQRSWDLAAEMADRGAGLPAIVARVLEVAGPQVDADLTLAIPRHGRAFFSSLSRAILWGIAVDGCLLVLGSTGARPVPGLTIVICVGVVLWAAGFGVVAGNHKVRERRIRAAATQRAALKRLAAEGARHVWAAQVAGDWQPCGPVPDAARSDRDSVPSAWLRRFGAEPSEVAGALIDGTALAVRRALRAAGGKPVALFVWEPGAFTDDARTLADDWGVALFVVGPGGLYAMSDLGSTTLDAYQRASTRERPAGHILARWADRAPARAGTGTGAPTAATS